MLVDREASYQSLVSISQGLEGSLAVKEQMNQLDKQWKEVNKLMSDNEKVLENTLTISQSYNEKLEPLLVWLDQKERQLSQSKLQTPCIDKAAEYIQELAVCFLISFYHLSFCIILS